MNEKIKSIPLYGWLVSSETAEILGISPQAIHKMMAAGMFKIILRVGKKPIYLIREAEVHEIKKQREEKKELED